MQELSKTIYTLMTRGHLLPWWIDHKPLVEYGIARFLKKESEPEVAIEEPLAVISIIQYFRLNGYTLEVSIRDRVQDEKGMALEEAVLLVLTRLLQGNRALRSIFEFRGRSPGWARCKAQIVARDTSGNFQPFSIDNPGCISSALACNAQTMEDVTRWLREGKEAWCIPGILMGPDLMARVRFNDERFNDEKILLLVIQGKCHTTGSEHLKASVTAQAILSLKPSRYFQSVVRD